MTGNQTHFHKPNDSAEGTKKKAGLEGPKALGVNTASVGTTRRRKWELTKIERQ
jgi:hypothetical protein